ncbi:hypothetical protein HMPREF1624_07503 [Sporothrix schenckii ATCC 58251]|uniref:Uncharacterized protein n=1 Tax=Sporothrix schenckii (strain ATCC 58251 / de Perez 2211183) TaxID=1391915 RepID=U7PK05_SPOS1|nr:hypothetical protein HMPREF1624_07503 [Sporothrix schenckii ATCC 58251]
MTALPVESSWRMVEGEHDSFDTSIVPHAFGLSGDDGDDGDDPFVSSSGAPSQQSAGSGAGPAAAARSGRGLGRRTVSGASGISSVSRGGASSSQEDRISLGGDSFGSGSIPGSQDDDIHSFLRKAENDERVLLRSPFQPSLPSSVRQSPLSANSAGKAKTAASASRLDRSNRTFQTPEPEFRMPTIDMDGSLHAGDGRIHPQNQRVAGLSSSFRVSDTGSPVQRRSTGGGLLSRLTGQRKANTAKTPKDDAHDAGSSGNGPTTTAAAAAAAWRRAVPSSRALLFVVLPIIGLIAVCGMPLFYSTAIHTACSLPGVPLLGLPFCPNTAKANNKTTIPAQNDGINTDTDTASDTALQDGNYWAIRHRFSYESRQAVSEGPASPPVTPIVSLVRSAGQLMRVQTQLADVVKERVLVRRSNNVPPAQDAWLVPRALTKDLVRAAQMNTATLPFLSIELDAYLDAAKRVSMALTRLQTGAVATAADTLTYRSQQTLAHLKRIAATTSEAHRRSDGSGSRKSWLSRVFSPASNTRRTQLLDTYRRHVDAVLRKTQLRVGEAEAVFHALEAAGAHLATVQQYVVAKKLELLGANVRKAPDRASTGGGPGGDPLLDTSGGLFSWLWSIVFERQPDDGVSSSTKTMSKAARVWSGYADQVQRLHEDHEAAVGRAAEALDELAAVRDALSVLQTELNQDGRDGTNNNEDGDVDMRLHMDIVDAGIQDLEKVGR